MKSDLLQADHDTLSVAESSNPVLLTVIAQQIQVIPYEMVH